MSVADCHGHFLTTIKMKNIKFLFLGLLFISLANSCEQKEKTTVQNIKEPSQATSDSTNISKFLQFSDTKKMGEINDRIDPNNRVESLSWEKHTQHGAEYLTVTAYLNEDGFPMKMVEDFIDGNLQPEGKREYYLEDNKLIYFKESKDVWLDSNTTQYVETKTVYNKNEPVMTLTRSAAFDDIQDSIWNEIPTEHPSLERVNNILAGEGRFQTYFISVVKADHLFLLLGENKDEKEDRYTTAVRVDKMTPFIKDLLNHLQEYKFRPVDIKFTVVGGNDQPEFRVLTDIHWKNKNN